VSKLVATAGADAYSWYKLVLVVRDLSDEIYQQCKSGEKIHQDLVTAVALFLRDKDKVVKRFKKVADAEGQANFVLSFATPDVWKMIQPKLRGVDDHRCKFRNHVTKTMKSVDKAGAAIDKSKRAMKSATTLDAGVKAGAAYMQLKRASRDLVADLEEKERQLSAIEETLKQAKMTIDDRTTVEKLKQFGGRMKALKTAESIALAGKTLVKLATP